jgi:hypothetical protein
MKSQLRVAAENVKAWEQAQGSRLLRFQQALQKTRYPRAVPPRYRLPLQRVLAEYPPAELPEEERNKPVPENAPELPNLPPDPEIDEINAAWEEDQTNHNAGRPETQTASSRADVRVRSLGKM